MRVAPPNATPPPPLESAQLLKLVRELNWVIEDAISDAEAREKLRAILRPFRGAIS